MVQATKRKASLGPAAAPSPADTERAPSLKVADAGAVSVDSPARRMQRQIARELGVEPEPRWSARRTVVFLVLTNSLFWAGVVLAVRAAA